MILDFSNFGKYFHFQISKKNRFFPIFDFRNIFHFQMKWYENEKYFENQNRKKNLKIFENLKILRTKIFIFLKIRKNRFTGFTFSIITFSRKNSFCSNQFYFEAMITYTRLELLFTRKLPRTKKLQPIFHDRFSEISWIFPEKDFFYISLIWWDLVLIPYFKQWGVCTDIPPSPVFSWEWVIFEDISYVCSGLRIFNGTVSDAQTVFVRWVFDFILTKK